MQTNFKAGQLKDPRTAEVEKILRTCVHCGICLPHCPTYRVLGEEMDSPRGRLYLMRAVGEGRIAPTETFRRHLDLCLGCRACETACPSGVPFGSLLEAARAQTVRTRRRVGLHALLHAVFAGIFGLTMIQMSRNAPPPQLAIQAVVIDASQIGAASRREQQERERRRIQQQEREQEQRRQQEQHRIPGT